MAVKPEKESPRDTLERCAREIVATELVVKPEEPPLRSYTLSPRDVLEATRMYLNEKRNARLGEGEHRVSFSFRIGASPNECMIEYVTVNRIVDPPLPKPKTDEVDPWP